MRRTGPGRRYLRGARVLLGLVVAGTLLDMAPVRAQEDGGDDGTTSALAGYQGSAAASGLHAFYNLEGVLPLPPPVDIGAPDALATIASGPATFARAGVLDPGDLLANPDAVLALLAAEYPAGTLPPFPYRITASSGVGEPTAESNPAPGLNATVSADLTGSSARATMPVLAAPAIATVGTLTSTATTTTDGSTVTVRARSQMGELDILGLITIDSLVTDVSATSDGGEVELSGGTEVLGASVLGTPVTIDAEGIHVAPGASSLLGGLLRPLTGSLNEILERIGLHITVAGPVELAGGGAGQLAAAGLRVDFELNRSTFPALTDLLDAIPPIENPLPGLPSIEDLLVVAQARHLLSLEIGRGVVALQATNVGGGALPEVPDLPDLAAPSGIDLPVTSPGIDLPGPSVPVASGGTPGGAEDAPDIPVGAGVGALVLLALLAQPFMGERIGWACAAVLAADRHDRCALEER